MSDSRNVVNTGFVGFDKLTGGLRGGDLVCLASRPGTGKSSLALNIAFNVATAERPKAVLIFSLELTAIQVAARLYALKTGTPSWRDADDSWPAASSALNDVPFYIVDKGGLGVKDMAVVGRKMKDEPRRREPVGMVIVDYFQLVGGPGGWAGDRAGEMRLIAQGLKALARELDAPILVVSQLARRAPKNGEPESPRVDDLREAHAIVECADVVALLHRPGNGRPNMPLGEREEAELLVVKNKRGPRGVVRLDFFKDSLRFRER